MESVKEKGNCFTRLSVKKKRELKKQIEQNITTYFEFLHSQFCQSRKRQWHEILWDLNSFCQHLLVADSQASAQSSLEINNVGEKSHLHDKRFENRTKFSSFLRVQVEWRNDAFVKIGIRFWNAPIRAQASPGKLRQAQASPGNLIVFIVLEILLISMEEGPSLV